MSLTQPPDWRSSLSGILSLDQAAAALTTSERRIAVTLEKAGGQIGCKLGRTWLVHRDELAALAALIPEKRRRDYPAIVKDWLEKNNLTASDLSSPEQRAVILNQLLIDCPPDAEDNSSSYKSSLGHALFVVGASRPLPADADYITSAEAAAMLGMTDSGIRRLVGRGKLPAKKMGHDLLIRREDISSIKKSRAGRPPKEKNA